MNAVPRDNEPGAPDEWYYRFDGRERGPLSSAAIQDLVGASGETADTVEIRHGLDEKWILFRKTFRMPTSDERQSFLPAALPQSSEGISNRPQRSRWASHNLLQAKGKLAVGIALWLLANLAVLHWWPQAHCPERRYLAALRQIQADAIALRECNTSLEQWKTLREQARATVDPIISDLKKSASASEPSRQHLLWAARDQFQLLGPHTSATKESERLLEEHLLFVERQLDEF